MEREEIDTLLEIIQHFYPAGTGARSVAECLYLQLREEGAVPEAYQTLLFYYLEDIAEYRTKKIEKETGISSHMQIEFLNKLKSLHPRPGSQFTSEEKTYYVVPDGSINWSGGILSVKLNNVGTPPLVINPLYQEMLTNESYNAQTREYISERMNRALVLLRNIDAREKTIKTIASVIAEAQREYLLGITNTLNPLTQKQIAAKTGFHESTISRTVRGKYFLTPRGTMELKSLFCNSCLQGDQTVTVYTIKKTIRILIEQEDPACPLTDQEIADRLSSETASIARRTVAKYRKELGIQTASKRRMRIYS